MNCTHCNKRLSRKTARMIDGVVMCSTCMFADSLAMKPPPPDWVPTRIEGVDPADMMAWSRPAQADTRHMAETRSGSGRSPGGTVGPAGADAPEHSGELSSPSHKDTGHE